MPVCVCTCHCECMSHTRTGTDFSSLSLFLTPPLPSPPLPSPPLPSPHRVLPYELGRLFLLQTLGLTGNPLQPDILSMVNEVNGTAKLLSFLLDNLTGGLEGIYFSRFAPRGKDMWICAYIHVHVVNKSTCT